MLALTNQAIKEPTMADMNRSVDAPHLKTCSCCRTEKKFSEYYRDKKTKDGMYSRCKSCHLLATSQWSKKNNDVVASSARARRAKNPEKHKAYSNQYKLSEYADNPEKFRALSKANRAKDPAKTNACSYASRAKNPDATAKYLANYYQQNKVVIKEKIKQRAERLREELKPANCEKAMRRNAKKKNASPSWADRAAIQAIYADAAAATKATGIKHHVDHIVPLQGKTVSGLHVEFNLRILPKLENQSKGNRWWPDKP